MPIRAENKAHYPEVWPLISLTVRALAGYVGLRNGGPEGPPH